MSIEAVSYVLPLPVSGNAKVILLGVANHAHPDGTESYPSVKRLATYIAGAEATEDELTAARRTVQRNLRVLEAEGWIVRDGKGALGQTKWRIPMGERHFAAGGGDVVLGGVTSVARGASPVSPEPSLEPSKGKPSLKDMSNSVEIRSIPLDLFAYWQDKCNHPNAKPTRERLTKIKQRLLGGYTVANIEQAIDGAARLAFVDENGKRFDDIELICRNGAKLEDFMARATAKPKQANGRRHVAPSNSPTVAWVREHVPELPEGPAASVLSAAWNAGERPTPEQVRAAVAS